MNILLKCSLALRDLGPHELLHLPRRRRPHQHKHLRLGDMFKVVVTAGASMQIYHLFVLYTVYLYQLKISYHILDIGDLID